jgi:hypothetical protein
MLISQPWQVDPARNCLNTYTPPPPPHLTQAAAFKPHGVQFLLLIGTGKLTALFFMKASFLMLIGALMWMCASWGISFVASIADIVHMMRPMFVVVNNVLHKTWMVFACSFLLATHWPHSFGKDCCQATLHSRTIKELSQWKHQSPTHIVTPSLPWAD